MKRYTDGENEAPHIRDVGNNKVALPFESLTGSEPTADLDVVIKKRSQNHCHKYNVGLLAGRFWACWIHVLLLKTGGMCLGVTI
jgi:hypothetical protein